MDQSFSLTRVVKSFEREWESAPPAAIEEHLTSVSGGRRLTLLQELICIDMEFRWRSNEDLCTSPVESASLDFDGGQRTGGDATVRTLLVDDYLSKFPELGDVDSIDLLLIEEEFRVRSCWGDRPEIAEYLRRFPSHAASLPALLEAIRSEFNEQPEDRRGGEVAAISVHDFLQRLAGSRLYSVGDSEELRTQVDAAGPFADAATVGEWLVQREKLTPGQLQILLKGPMCPLTLGPYVILDVIGAGGMGQVYKALHREMQREVALKTLKASGPETSDSTQRFRREAQAAARLVHPNVVVAHDAGEIDGVRFLVMEFVEGQNLSSLVRRSGPLPVSKAIDCVLQAAEGLKYAHQRGVIHRDVKPSNLLLDDDGVVKVLDLGLARFNEPDNGRDSVDGDPLTGAGMVMGTADYMAPEQAAETRTADERADIYSLGCTMHFLLTGKRVFPAESVWKTLSHHHDKPIPSLRDQCADVSPELDSVFLKMLAKQAADRFQTMQEVIDALSSVADNSEVASLSETPRVTRSSDSTLETNLATGDSYATAQTIVLPQSDRIAAGRSWMLIGSAVLVAVFVGIGIWFRSDTVTIHKEIAPVSFGEVHAPPTVKAEVAAERLSNTERDLHSVAEQRDIALAAVWATQNEDERRRLRESVNNLPSPLDSLRQSDIPADVFRDSIQYDQSGYLQDNLVAVLGYGETKHWNWVNAVSFTNDSKRVISAGEDGTVVFRDAVSGNVLRRLVVDGVVAAMTIAPDDKSLFLYLGDKVAI